MPAALRVVIRAAVSKADSEGSPRTKATAAVKIDQIQLKLPIGSGRGGQPPAIALTLDKSEDDAALTVESVAGRIIAPPTP